MPRVLARDGPRDRNGRNSAPRPADTEGKRFQGLGGSRFRSVRPVVPTPMTPLRNTVLRGDIERALDDLVAHEEGMRFQALAVILAKARWPDLIACERRYDLGCDARGSASAAPDGRGKALAASLTPTSTKLKADAQKVATTFKDVSLFIFVTPASLTNYTIQPWAAEIQRDYGYELIVLSREDIISALLAPANASLCRTFLGIDAPISATVAEQVQKVRTACVEGASAWTAHARLTDAWRIPLRATRLGERGRQVAAVAVDALRVLLLDGHRVILEAPAGRGKTTTLIEVASMQQTEDQPIALWLLVDFPAWIRSRIGIFAFLASTPPFLSSRITAYDIASVSDVVHVSFLLNGWNEIPERYSNDAIVALRELERGFPRAGVVVATRTHHIRPPLPGALTLQLLPLDQNERRDYLHAALGDAGEPLALRFEVDGELDDLTRTPFILAAIVQLALADTPIPDTATGVFDAVMRLTESSAEHSTQLQMPPLNGRARTFLKELALALTERGETALNDEDACRIVAKVTTGLRDAGQLANPPEPLSILGALTAHHVLEFIPGPAAAFRFQHQQLQEWFASTRITERLLNISVADKTALRQFTLDYVNRPIWTEALCLVAEELGRQDTAETLTVGRLLIESALRVHPTFAAILVRRCGKAIREVVRRAIETDLRAWYQRTTRTPVPALTAMLATGFPDFVDILVPYLTDSDSSRAAALYDGVNEFPVSSLGADWRQLVSTWPARCRVHLVHHLRIDLAEEFATTDPDHDVRLAAIDRINWAGARVSLARTLTRLDTDTFERALWQSHHISLPPAVHERARHIYSTLLERATTASNRLRLLVALETVGGADIPSIQGELTRLASQCLADNVIHHTRAALAIIHRVDPSWVSEWVTRRIIDGGPRKAEGLSIFVTHLSGDQREELLRAATGDQAAGHLVQDTVRQLADVELARRAFQMLCAVRQSTALAAEGRVREQNLLSFLRSLQPFLVGAGVALSVSDTFDTVKYLAVIDVFAGIQSSDEHWKRELAPADRAHIRAYLKSGFEWVIGQHDFSGTLRAHAASALGRVGEPEDASDLWRLIEADLERSRTGRGAWRAGDRDERAQGGTTSWTRWYVDSLVTVDPERADEALVRLLWEPEYEDDAAAALVGLVAPPRKPRAWPFSTIDYDAVRAARVRPAEPSARAARYATELSRRLEHVLGACEEGNSAAVLMSTTAKRHAARLASLDGVNSATRILDILARPGRFDEWIRLDALEALLMAGATLPSEDTLRVLQPAMDRGLHDLRRHEQARFVLHRCLCLLPFVAPPKDGIERIRSLLGTVPIDGHECARLVKSLGESHCPEALPLLLEIAVREKASFPLFVEAWLNALLVLGTTEAQQVLLGIIDPEVDVPALLQPDVRMQVAASIAEIARATPHVRDRVIYLCSRPLSPAHRALLAAILELLGERSAVLSSLDLIGDSLTPPIPDGIARAVEHVAIEYQPAGTNTYILRPSNAADLRRRLFGMLRNDPARRHTALSLLLQIEEWRVKYGRPLEEPWHPDIHAGGAWWIATAEPALSRAHSRNPKDATISLRSILNSRGFGSLLAWLGFKRSAE